MTVNYEPTLLITQPDPEHNIVPDNLPAVGEKVNLNFEDIAAAIAYILANLGGGSQQFTVAQITDFAIGVMAALHYGTTAGSVCEGNDPRLSNARTPTSHTQTAATISDFAAAVMAALQYGNTSGSVCQGNDPRLSDARTPIAHSHVLAAITDFLFGAVAGTICQGNDLRLSNSRTPTTHESSHIQAGSDEIDGDQLDVDWNPTNYSPTVVTEAASVDMLSAHLAGIDAALASGGIPSDLAKLANDGRIDLAVSGVGDSLCWNGSTIGLYDSTNSKWGLVKPSTLPTLSNVAPDFFGNPLIQGCNYDIFAEFVSATAVSLIAVPWVQPSQSVTRPDATPAMTANNAPSPYLVAATSELSGSYPAWYTLDGSTATFWVSGAAPSTGAPQNIMFDFGAGASKNIVGYRFRTRDSSDTNVRASPRDFKFQGTTNAAAAQTDSETANGWTTLDTQTGFADPGQAAWSPYFYYRNLNGYRKFRLFITNRNGIDADVVIAEIELVEGWRLGDSARYYPSHVAGANYVVGDLILHTDGHYYWCQTAHTSTSTFDPTKWVDNGSDPIRPGLYKHEGRYVQANSAAGKKRLFLGVVRPYIDPTAAVAWDSSTTFAIGRLVTSGGHTYISKRDGNQNHAVTDTAWWQDCGTSYDNRGVFVDQENIRFVLNSFNKITKRFGRTNPYTGTTTPAISGSVWAAWVNNSDWQINAIFDGIETVSLYASVAIYCGSNDTLISIGMDANTPHTMASIPDIWNAQAGITALLCAAPSAGLHFFRPLGYSSSATLYLYSNTKAQFQGTIKC